MNFKAVWHDNQTYDISASICCLYFPFLIVNFQIFCNILTQRNIVDCCNVVETKETTWTWWHWGMVPPVIPCQRPWCVAWNKEDQVFLSLGSNNLVTDDGNCGFKLGQVTLAARDSYRHNIAFTFLSVIRLPSCVCHFVTAYFFVLVFYIGLILTIVDLHSPYNSILNYL